MSLFLPLFLSSWILVFLHGKHTSCGVQRISYGLLKYICSLFSVSPSHVISYVPDQRFFSSFVIAPINVDAMLQCFDIYPDNAQVVIH